MRADSKNLPCHNPPFRGNQLYGNEFPYIVLGLPMSAVFFCSHPDRSAPHQSISLSGPSVPSPARQGCKRFARFVFPELPLLPSEGSPLIDSHGLAVLSLISPSTTTRSTSEGVRFNQGFYQVNSRHKADLTGDSSDRLLQYPLFPVSREPISHPVPHTLQRQWWSPAHLLRGR